MAIFTNGDHGASAYRVLLRRREAAIEPGTPLEVRWHDGIIEIEPQPLQVKLQRKGRLLVAAPATRVPPLRTATVERTRRQIGRRRDGR